MGMISDDPNIVKLHAQAEQVGHALGVTRAAVSNWELGNHGFPIETIYNVALFFRVPVRSLLP